jgi:UDP-N-acetylmuramoylalanine--D-glutamate ligase
LTPGFHQKQNLLAASLALLDLGLPPDFIRESLGRFPGIEHRLEFFHEAAGIGFYNDTAATIPEAAAAAVNAFTCPLVLVTGGTDKNLDFSPLAAAVSKAAGENRLVSVILLAGTGSEKLRALLERDGIRYQGPFDDLDTAVKAALNETVKTTPPQPESAVLLSNENAALLRHRCAVLLSPGCASFGMFLNEFDRGRKWKETVKRLA